MAGIFGLLMSGAGVIKDQYYNLTSLLLPGNGTNGKQNNAFLDSSGQNGGAGWTITPNGNATQGTFSPFSQTGWSAYFDGSNDYVTATLATALTSTYTIDFWINTNSVAAGDKCILNIHTTSSNTVGFVVKRNGSQIQVNDGATGGTGPSGGTLAVGVWKFVTIVCNATNTLLYIDGSLVNTYSGVTLSGSPTFVHIGSFGDLAAGNYADAYISNLRIIVGSAITPSATPPTSPSQSTGSTTKLLTLQSNRFVDNGTNSLTVTPNNGVAITPFSPFAPTQSYSAAAVGGSGYFDGTLDSLTGPTSNSAFAFGTGAYSVEAWVYLTGFDNGGVNAAFVVDCGGATNAFNMIVNTNGSLALNKYGVGAVITGNSGKIALNSWNHIAICRNSTASNDTRLFVNGALDTTGTDSNDWTVNTTPTFGGAGNLTTLDVIGYLSGIRIIKSQALATSAFTPPTAPVSASTVGWNGSSTAISGTCSLLLNFTNAGVVDATAKNVLETVGNAQISTTQSKWGGGSMYFPGTVVDTVKSPSSPLLGLGTGNFTIEFWVYPTTLGTSERSIFCLEGTSPFVTCAFNSSSKLFFYNVTEGTVFTSATTFSINNWYYVAIVREGTSTNQTKLYVNGSLDVSGTSSLNYPQNPILIGNQSGGTTKFIGYIDDFRVTRYARTITASPTAPFPVQ